MGVKGVMTNLKSDSTLGSHLLVDFFGVDRKRLQGRSKLMEVLRSALKEAGFRMIKEAGSYKFNGGGKGVTGFILLAESHVAFHSYPEYEYMALDIYSCGKHNPKPIVDEMEKHLNPRKVTRIFYKRGIKLIKSSF